MAASSRSGTKPPARRTEEGARLVERLTDEQLGLPTRPPTSARPGGGPDDRAGDDRPRPRPPRRDRGEAKGCPVTASERPPSGRPPRRPRPRPRERALAPSVGCGQPPEQR